MNKHWLHIQVFFGFFFPSLMGLITVGECFYLGQIFEIKFLSLCAVVAFAAMLTGGLQEIDHDDFFYGFWRALGIERYFGPRVTIPAICLMTLTAATFEISRDYVLYGMGGILLLDVLLSAISGKDSVYKKSVFRMSFLEWSSIDSSISFIIAILFEPVFYSLYMFLYAHDFIYLHMVIVTITALQMFKK